MKRKLFVFVISLVVYCMFLSCDLQENCANSEYGIMATYLVSEKNLERVRIKRIFIQHACLRLYLLACLIKSFPTFLFLIDFFSKNYVLLYDYIWQIYIHHQAKKAENKTNTHILTCVRMPQYVVYAIEKYLAISDNTCRTSNSSA